MQNNNTDPVAETIATYDQVAGEYRDRYLKDADQNHMQPLLELFIASLKGNKVLDVGSGAGFDAKWLSEKGYEVTSIDLSTKMMAIAKDLAPKAIFKKMDMRKMSFDNESFDGVWASASLLHIPKKEVNMVIREIKRVLRTGGIIFLGLKDGEGETFVINKGDNNLSGARRYFSYYKRAEIEELLKQNQLTMTDFSSNTNRENTWLNIFAKKS